MKKIIVILLFIFSLCACDNNDKSTNIDRKMQEYYGLHNEIMVNYRDECKKVDEKYDLLLGDIFENLYKDKCPTKYEEYINLSEEYFYITNNYLNDEEIKKINDQIREIDRLLKTATNQIALLREKMELYKEKEKIISQYNLMLHELEVKMKNVEYEFKLIEDKYKEEIESEIFHLQDLKKAELEKLENKKIESISKLDKEFGIGRE